jgi:sulfotransferase family protein
VNDSLFAKLGESMKTKPLDFLVIGAAKSGTTALFYYLRDHPNIYLPPEKEVSFFSNEDWLTKGWDAFVHEFFRHAPRNALWGKVTPHYMAYPHVPERLFNMMPQVKLIALLRNPVDRAFSHYRMAIRTGAESRDFSEVVSEQLAQLSSVNFLTLGEYGRILRSFFRLFPARQLRIFFTDDLEASPDSLVNSILTYLGLESGFSPANLGKRYHQEACDNDFPG